MGDPVPVPTIRSADLGLGAVFGVVALVLSYERLGEWAPWWAIMLLLVLTPAAVATSADWEAIGEGPASVQVVLAAGAMYACVPETDQFGLLVAFFIGYGALRASGRPPQTLLVLPVSVLLLATAGMIGAVGRWSAYVGVMVSLASLLVVPMWQRRFGQMSERNLWLIIGALGAVEMVAARTVGIAGT